MITSTRTDTGKVREENEDSILSMPELGLFAVADGMGGHRGGKVASQLIVAELRQRAGETELREAMELATLLTVINRRLLEVSSNDSSLQGMGSTCSLASIHGGKLLVGHVGDSRVYLMRDSDLQQITSDHRAVQQLIDEGALSEAEAERHPWRHMLTRSMGADQQVEIDLYERELRKNDLILLCSDGLTGMIGDDLVREVMSSSVGIDEKADQLISQAIAGGGQDNISVILIQIESSDAIER